MKAPYGSRRRLIGGLAVSGCLALLALQAPAAHAASTPHISASVERGRYLVHVTGYGFGPGDQVEVEDTAAGGVIGRAFTVASSIAHPPPSPSCRSTTPCRYFIINGGSIDVVVKNYVPCSYEWAAVRAYDLTNHTRSNVVHVRLGLGTCTA